MTIPASPSTPPAANSETAKAKPLVAAGLIYSQRKPITAKERLRGAELLRATLSSEPWHAKNAAQEAARTGDEMAYWFSLHSSQATIQTRLDGSLIDLPPAPKD